jgi:hypothetical protein
MRLDRGPTGTLGTLTEGPAPAFRPLHARSTLLRGEGPSAPSGPPAFPSLDVAPSYRLAAFLGRCAKMPRNRFYNRRFASTSTRWRSTTSGDSRRATVGNPPALDFEGRPRTGAFPPFRPSGGAGPPRGHPASGGLALRRRDAGFGPIGYPRSRRSAGGGRAPQPCRLAVCSAGSNPLAPLRGGGADCLFGPLSRRVGPFPPVHVNATDLPGLEAPSIARGRRLLPLGILRGALCPLAGGAAAARVHRGSKTPTRPLLARCSRTPSRPRALLRLLQVNVPTSTTVDRSNITTTESVAGTAVRRPGVASWSDSGRR